MTEKLGRKALFIDVCEDEGVKNEDQIDSGESIREDIQDLLEQGTQGNFSGRIDEEPADPVWKPVISKIHHLYGSSLEESCSSLLFSLFSLSLNSSRSPFFCLSVSFLPSLIIL